MPKVKRFSGGTWRTLSGPATAAREPPSCRLQIADVGIRRRLRFVNRAGGVEPQVEGIEASGETIEKKEQRDCVVMEGR